MIKEIYAFVAGDGEEEGVMAFCLDNHWYPMVGADMARIKSLLPMAEEISLKTGMPFKIIKFTERTDITDTLK